MSSRIERVNQLIKEEIAKLIQFKLKDPRMAGLVSVTRVKTSPDLKRADVYVSVYGGDEEMAKKTMAALNNAVGYLRHELGENIRLKHIPELVLHHDRSLEQGDRVLKIISELESREEDE